MCVWFYLFLMFAFISLLMIIKIIFMKRELKSIGKSLTSLLKTDTNALITVDINDRELKNLVVLLNKSLIELSALEHEFKNGNKELRETITNISHDLRTPLTAIRGYLDLMDKDTSMNSYLKRIDKKVIDLVELTDQLFYFSKTLDFEDELKRENICVNEILEESLASFYEIFKKNGIEPNINICSKKIFWFVDKKVLKRIFENIISNALKYSKEDFIVELTRDGYLTFSNRTDSIDSVTLAKIFNKLNTVRNARKSDNIGLAIVKQLCELCGGSINSKYENGILTLKISFPQSEEQ